MQIKSDIHSRLTNNNQCLVIGVEGYFTVHFLDKFIAAFEAQPPLKRYAINLEQCHGIDNSALGMLLMLRDYSKLEQNNLIISRCTPCVRNVLNFSEFDRIFTILN